MFVIMKKLRFVIANPLKGALADKFQTLYHQTLAIRPKLIELIGKYSQKKGKFGMPGSGLVLLT